MKYPYSINWARNRTSVAARMPDSLPLIFYSNFYFYEKFRTLVMSIRDHGLSPLLNGCMLPVPTVCLLHIEIPLRTRLPFSPPSNPRDVISWAPAGGSATTAVKRANSRLGVLV